MKDLLVLCSDKDMEFALMGLLSRPKALGISSIEYDIIKHPEHDPGVAMHGIEFVRSFASQYRHVLLIFDHEGCGREENNPDELKKQIRQDLSKSSWGDRCDVVVLFPELEAWIWSHSPHVDDVSGWKGKKPSLREWLISEGWLADVEMKPQRPKEAYEAALKEVGLPQSASLYRQISSKVSLKHCVDSAFGDFVKILQSWFKEN